MSPLSVELQEQNQFLWNELKSLSCPFYSRFLLWLISRVFLDVYFECRIQYFLADMENTFKHHQGVRLFLQSLAKIPLISRIP